MSIAGERAPGATGGLKADISSIRDPDGPRSGNQANAETFQFNKHYNKELKLCEDEIPMVLCELNESALAYLNRDQFDNALLLLQKAHGVLDVVDLTGSKRDQYIALQLFHNMAMCYQKQGQLEECALCLETTLNHLGTDYASDQSQSFAMRLYKMKIEVRLRLQFCAILSQLHRHKEAFEQAQEGIKIAHLIIRDKISITKLYSKRIDMFELYGISNEENLESLNIDKSDNLSQSEQNTSKYYQSSQKQKHNQKSVFDEKKKQQQKKINHKDDQSKSSYPFEEIFDEKILNLQTEQSFLNNLEGSISLVEKTSKKLLPIYKYVQQKIQIIEKKKLIGQFNKENQFNDEKIDQNINSSMNEDSSDVEVIINGKKNQSQRQISGHNKQKDLKKNYNIDLRHILGFLNQTEWIQNLNIGNIMQISPIKFEDLILIRRNEECLSRDSFLDVISFLIVGYFCASTEIRFIIQLKDEIPKFQNFSIDAKTQESELWHTMSLDIACSFLPSDCPLLNHILLSYQKHHAPSQSQILENQILDEKLRVVKPLNGIDNSKFQPIVRVLQNTKIDLPQSKIPPAQKTVSKMIQEINLKYQYSQERGQALFKQVKNAINTPKVLQNNKQGKVQSNLQSPLKKLNNYQQLKIQKIEAVIAKYSKDIGLEKNQVLLFLLGENQNHNYYTNHEEDFNNQKNAHTSHYDSSGLMNNRFYQNSQFANGNQGAHQFLRPQSQKESLSSRRNQDNQIQNNSTGIAAKIAYNNIGKQIIDESLQINSSIGQKSISSQSQSSLQYNKNGIGSREWTLSPQAQQKENNKNQTSFPVLNQADQSLNTNIDQESSKDDQNKILNQQQIRSQRIQLNQKINQTEEKNQFEQKQNSAIISEENQKENSLFNELNYQKLKHEKSYNEQHEIGNKFILNQSDFINETDSQQHHNFSINAASQGILSQGGTVRQPNKRMQSKDRDKVQRPRSSKGYRGNNIQIPQNQNNMNMSHNTSQNHTLAHSAINQNVVSAIKIQHQLSQNHLQSVGSIQQATNSVNSSSTTTGPKFQANKSEERALKSQQNQRPIVNKNQRQKTAGGNTVHAQSTTQITQQSVQGIGKEMIVISSNQNNINQVIQPKKLVNLTNQIMSQSSTQLPSAQITGNLTKLTKKQIQQMQQHQGQPLQQFQTNNGIQTSTQIGFSQANLNSNLTNYNSANQTKQSQKQKLNYDDLKKLLIKDQQQIQQNGNFSLLNQQNIQSQVGFQGINILDQNGIVLAQDLGRERSQPNPKPKKNNGQSQNQMQYSRDSSQNQSQKEIRNDFVLDQMKIGKGQQQASQPRKIGGPISAPHQGQPQIQLQQTTNQNLAIQQSHMTQQQAQQLYLNQLQANGPVRPNSSQKYKVKSQQGTTQSNQTQQNHDVQTQQQKAVNNTQQNLIINQRESNNKSALSTIGKHQAVTGGNPQFQGQLQQQQQQIIQQQIIMNVNNNISGGINNINNNGQNQNSNNSASLKRREKGRLIMQEWLVKSGKNLLTNPTAQIAITNVINPAKKINQDQLQ